MLNVRRLEFVILYELRKGTVLAEFFGWIELETLEDTLKALKEQDFISGEIIEEDVVVLKDIEITEAGRLKLETMLNDDQYEAGYVEHYSNQKLKDWVYEQD
ncbi:hypothetical protein [Macrococcus lamae]|uniref:Uncharacterized protein n=1 Tax=Macrococcus lamae TaxID=198484 RepID=A0A4R6BW15_9STAP|nr:hypothetical protein [Macrococcus lamae]TDM12585.1 hypothetical protein ERX29_02960 [Macrococcus lamae]